MLTGACRITGGVGTAAIVLALCAAPAAATGAYPGETLSLAQSGRAVAGQVTHFVAGGQQTDVDDYAGGFNLEVFAKNTNTDPTCSASYPGEQQSSLGDPYEAFIVIGEWQGSGSTFSVPFQYVFPSAGQVILCAYSAYITDTAAAASLVVNIASAVSKPADTRRPRVTRSGQRLRCVPGTWTGAPRFAYAWRTGGHLVHGAHTQTLAVTRSLKHRMVSCQVTASNSAGSATAASPAFHVR